MFDSTRIQKFTTLEKQKSSFLTNKSYKNNGDHEVSEINFLNKYLNFSFCKFLKQAFKDVNEIFVHNIDSACI